MNIEYYIINPTGNITALVTSNVQIEKYNIVSKKIMELYPDVEQVGFVNLTENSPNLRMSGGEFCGNATMSSAVLFCEKEKCIESTVKVNVYGSKDTFSVKVKKDGDFYSCELKVPKSNKIIELDFETENEKYTFPMVNFDGISHIIALNHLSESTTKKILVKYSKNLHLPAMGLMLYNKENNSLTPYVYVNECDTFFAENSCASGTCAVCEYLTVNSPSEDEFAFVQKGGTLKAKSSKNSDFITLYGNVKIEEHFIGEMSV